MQSNSTSDSGQSPKRAGGADGTFGSCHPGNPPHDVGKVHPADFVRDQAIFVVDHCQAIQSWNVGAELIFGFRRDEIVGESIQRLFSHEEFPAAMVQEFLDKANADGYAAIEGACLRKDGTRFRAAVSASRIVDGVGRAIGCAVAARDGVEGREADARLRTMDARVRTLFENSPLGILIADSESRYLDANETVCRMLGYSRDELLGKRAADIVMPQEIAMINEAIDEVRRFNEHRREWWFRRKDGSVFAAEVVATTMPDGTMVGLIKDLSDRRAAHAYREQWSAIVESSTDAIIAADLEGRITHWNAGAEALSGYSAAEAIGMPVARLYPPDCQEEHRWIHERLTCGERIERLETRRLTKEGQVVDVSVSVWPLRDPENRLIGSCCIARDITTIKHRERELARMSRLYSALSHINQAIVKTRDRDSLFACVCRTLVEHAAFRMAWIGWHDRDNHRLAPVSSWGDVDGYLHDAVVATDDRPEGRGVSGSAFRLGRPCVSNDALRDANAGPWLAALQACGYQSAASFPIRVDGVVQGVLSVYAGTPNYFAGKEIRLLEEAAEDVSFALDNLAREAERLQAQRAAEDERRFTQTMIESMPGILYFYDLTGKFLRWNRNFETASGYTGEEIRSMHPLDFFEGDDKQRVADRIAEVFDRGESSVEADFRSKDGSFRPYFFTGRRVEIEGKHCLVGVGIDVSERRQAEMQLAQSERKYRELVECANSIILRWNADGRITFLNEFGQRLFGYSLDEIVGRHVIGTIVPETETSGRDLQRLMDEICADPEAFEQNVNENMRRNGERIWVAWTNRVERDSEGRITEIFSIGADITARRQAEAERERRHRAEAADRIKSAFLATMSHELRTPLNSIIGFTGIILQELAGPLNAEQTKQLNMVRSSARHLLALVNDVLDISKIEAGQLEIERLSFEPLQSIQKVIALMTPQAETKGLRIRADAPENLGAVVGDQRRFEQILVNLLNNAIKFTERGEVCLRAEAIPEFVRGDDPPRPAIRVQVSDTGIGIRSEDMSTLFQPFRQIDSGISRKYEGTGLGLAICRKLADMMHGQISAESEWGKGTKITFIMPID